MDAVQELINSSELEFSDDDDPLPVANHRKRGQASIDKMIADAEQDRISSKKVVKKLRFEAAAPGTKENQSLWVDRFNAFREHVLRQSINVPFTGEDMIRFMSSIISKSPLSSTPSSLQACPVGKIRPRDSGKIAPNLDVIENAYMILLRYGTFRWSKRDGFDITAHDGARFKSFTTQAVKEKRLIKGSFRKRTWVGFITLSRMVRVFLEYFIQNGAWNFDVVMSKCLSVVLIASLSCRSGDVALSQGYTEEYLRYKHIELYLEKDDDAAGDGEIRQPGGFQDLRAIITLDYTKGHKDVENKSVVRYLRPLDNIQSIHVCPIALLLVHALRNGLVYGTTLEDVLQHTAAQPDLHVQWKYPERPVLTNIARKPSRCDLDVVPRTSQVADTVKQMGVISGMLSRVYGHSLRLGAIRDYAHLTKTASTTLPSTEDIRSYAGHTFKTMQKGVTENYAGDIARDYYNDIAADGGVHHRRNPKFALDGDAYREAIQQRVSAEEIQAELDQDRPGRDVSSLTAQEKRTMQGRVRRKRAEALVTSAPAEPVATRRTASDAAAAAKSPLYPAPAPPPPPQQLPPHAQAGGGMPSAKIAAATVTTTTTRPTTLTPTSKPRAGRHGLVEADQGGGEAPVAAPLPSPHPYVSGSGRVAALTSAAATVGSTVGDATSNDPVFLSKIDPDLLDEDALSSLQASKEDVDALQAVIFPRDADQEQEAEEGDDGFEEQDDVVLQGVAASDAALRDNIEEAARVLLGQDDRPEQGGSGGSSSSSTTKSLLPVWTASNNSHAGWIDGFARHNIVKNINFANAWKSFAEGGASFEESVGQHSMRGNSRDEPTPHVFHCRRTEGCGYEAIKHPLIERHEMSCSGAYVQMGADEEGADDVEVLECEHPGCGYKTTAGKHCLRLHVVSMHDWTPKACEECDDGVIYQTKTTFTKHVIKVHSGLWPARCTFPDCSWTKEFNDETNLVYHLQVKHGLLTGEARRPYLPRSGRKRWVSMECVVDTCTSKVLWKGRSKLLAHLKSVHKMNDEDAGELVDRKARIETFVPKSRGVLGPRNDSSKKRNGQQALVAPGKENQPPAAMGDVQGRPGGHGIAGAEPALKKPRAKKS